MKDEIVNRYNLDFDADLMSIEDVMKDLDKSKMLENRVFRRSLKIISGIFEPKNEPKNERNSEHMFNSLLFLNHLVAF